MAQYRGYLAIRARLIKALGSAGQPEQSSIDHRQADTSPDQENDDEGEEGHEKMNGTPHPLAGAEEDIEQD